MKMTTCKSAQDFNDDFNVMIPARKATPSSVIRVKTVSREGEDGHPSVPNHVPHEPYKGAVWSKPVRLGGTRVRSYSSLSLRGSATSAPDTSTGEERKTRSSSGVDAGPRTMGHSGFTKHKVGLVQAPGLNHSILAPKLSPSHERPVSVVVPVKNPSTSVSLEASSFQGSSSEAMRVEILRLREENRRLQALRRSGDAVDEAAASSASPDSLAEENRRLSETVKALNSQLQVQAQVNQDLKKLVIASIGDDLQYRFETISSSRAQLDQEANHLLKSLDDTREELEKRSIECDVWKSKFVASRVIIDELGQWKSSFHAKHKEMKRILRLLIDEQESLHSLETATSKNLSELSFLLCQRYPRVTRKADDLCLNQTKEKTRTKENRNLLEVARENRSVAQTLNIQVAALIQVAADRSTLSSINSQSPSVLHEPGQALAKKSSVILTPAGSLALEILDVDESPPAPSANDAIAYLDNVLSLPRSNVDFTFKCCEKCNGEIKTI